MQRCLSPFFITRSFSLISQNRILRRTLSEPLKHTHNGQKNIGTKHQRNTCESTGKEKDRPQNAQEGQDRKQIIPGQRQQGTVGRPGKKSSVMHISTTEKSVRDEDVGQRHRARQWL